MDRAKRVFLVLAIATLAQSAVFAGTVAPDDFTPTKYELRGTSYLVDDCLQCLRPLIQVPLRGSFVLTRLPRRAQGNYYEITELEISSTVSELPYTITGSGSLSRTGPQLGTQRFELEVDVNGTSGIRLEGSAELKSDPWPVFDIEVAETEARDPLHIFRLQIAAAPVTDMVLYEVLGGPDGSYFIDECLPCGRPIVLRPVEGTFLLGKISSGPNPFITFRIDALDLRGTAPDSELRITGLGVYRHGGEVAVQQSIELDIRVEGLREAQLGATLEPVTVAFPGIDVVGREVDPQTDTSVLSLRLVARPASENKTAFLRADANADGTFDIADPLFHLAWLFGAGDPPVCLEAADINADGGHDVSDAIYGLLYLFVAGEPPPPPGPTECGVVPRPVDCASYPPCDAA